MSDYIQVEFEYLSNEEKEVIIALLSEKHYEGFEEEGDLLKAYISSNLFEEEELRNFSNEHQLSFSVTMIENRNWNKEWESNFHPVIIDRASANIPWVAVRAAFHEPIKNAEHEIIITPKMSFGTGHHATTFMMMKMMSEIDFKEKKVLDFGTGTGILAILAEKLGSSKIVGIDIDEQSIENARENFDLNQCANIELKLSSSADGDQHFDMILANIIKKVIVDNLNAFAKQLKPNGILLLSGLLKDDRKDILDAIMNSNLGLKEEMEMEGWLCLKIDNKLVPVQN